MTTLTSSTQLEVTSCGECGIPFAMPASMLKEARQDSRRRFWCPNGHKLLYADSENDRLERQLKEARAQRDRASARATHEHDQRLAAERSAAAFKGQATRLRKRAAHGVCACCHRQFANVDAHMRRKHPEFVAEAGT